MNTPKNNQDSTTLYAKPLETIYDYAEKLMELLKEEKVINAKFNTFEFSVDKDTYRNSEDIVKYYFNTSKKYWEDHKLTPKYKEKKELHKVTYENLK